MDRQMAAALIEQLCRALPPEPDFFWLSERIGAVAARCEPRDRPYVYQIALWYMDDAGLFAYQELPRFNV